MSWSREPVMWSTCVYTNHMWLNHVPLPRRHPWSSTKSLKFNQIFDFIQILTSNQILTSKPKHWLSSYLSIPLDLMKLSLISRFDNVKAYLWSVSRRGSGGFSWRMSILAPEATDLLVLLTRYLNRWTQQDWAIWKRRTSASNCPLWVSMGETQRQEGLVFLDDAMESVLFLHPNEWSTRLSWVKLIAWMMVVAIIANNEGVQ